MRQPQQSAADERGFTIVELLIATTVLSVILLLVSVMMLGIGRLYFKGINQARIQNNARSITDELSQQLQYNLKGDQFALQSPGNTKNNGSYTITMNVYCIGANRYTYALEHQIGPDNTSTAKQQIQHVLWRDTIAAGSCPNDADLRLSDPATALGYTGVPGTGTELIAPQSRLTAFALHPHNPTTASPYEITVGVAYGVDDLLPARPYSLSTRCNTNTGDQFCATASLKTNAGKRLD